MERNYQRSTSVRDSTERDQKNLFMDKIKWVTTEPNGPPTLIEFGEEQWPSISTVIEPTGRKLESRKRENRLARICNTDISSKIYQNVEAIVYP